MPGHRGAQLRRRPVPNRPRRVLADRTGRRGAALRVRRRPIYQPRPLAHPVQPPIDPALHPGVRSPAGGHGQRQRRLLRAVRGRLRPARGQAGAQGRGGGRHARAHGGAAGQGGPRQPARHAHERRGPGDVRVLPGARRFPVVRRPVLFRRRRPRLRRVARRADRSGAGQAGHPVPDGRRAAFQGVAHAALGRRLHAAAHHVPAGGRDGPHRRGVRGQGRAHDPVWHRG